MAATIAEARAPVAEARAPDTEARAPDAGGVFRPYAGKVLPRGGRGVVRASAVGDGRQAEASSRARVNTASSIGSVSLPVNVFCWETW